MWVAVVGLVAVLPLAWEFCPGGVWLVGEDCVDEACVDWAEASVAGGAFLWERGYTVELEMETLPDGGPWVIM